MVVKNGGGYMVQDEQERLIGLKEKLEVFRGRL
jgi:hypothetical protein